MITLIRRNKYFYFLCLLFFVAGGIYLLVNDKGTLSLFFNAHRSPAADYFFRYATWMGDGIVVSSVCVLLLFVKYRYGVVAAIVSFLSSFIVSILKNIFNAPRPVEYFKTEQLNFVEKVELYHWLSFPSGHTAAAFALFSVLSFFVAKKPYTIIFFSLAFFVAMSRVYLLQHFFVDVYFGALFGCINALVIYYLLMRSPLFANKHWHERSLINNKLKGAG